MFRHGYDGHAAVYRVHGIIAAPRPQRLLAALHVEDWETDDGDGDSESGDHESEDESDEAEDEQAPEGNELVVFTDTRSSPA